MAAPGKNRGKEWETSIVSEEITASSPFRQFKVAKSWLPWTARTAAKPRPLWKSGSVMAYMHLPVFIKSPYTIK
jgi:hypothetical protein